LVHQNDFSKLVENNQHHFNGSIPGQKFANDFFVFIVNSVLFASILKYESPSNNLSKSVFLLLTISTLELEGEMDFNSDGEEELGNLEFSVLFVLLYVFL